MKSGQQSPLCWFKTVSGPVAPYYTSPLMPNKSYLNLKPYILETRSLNPLSILQQTGVVVGAHLALPGSHRPSLGLGVFRVRVLSFGLRV